ncbi:MAG: class I SAM-dependent methyltransferase [Clostridiales bacterium]|nr:class I SAM-dependent methyltransferase [Clostridiales bacterium]
MNIEIDIPYLIDKLPKTDGLMLDVGTGKGVMAENLAKRGYHVVTVEYNEERLQETRQDFEDMGIEKVLFINADAQNLPFLNETFDLVTCYNAVHHFDDYARALNEMERVLKKGGILVVTELNEEGKKIVAERHRQHGRDHNDDMDIYKIRDILTGEKKNVYHFTYFDAVICEK